MPKQHVTGTLRLCQPTSGGLDGTTDTVTIVKGKGVIKRNISYSRSMSRPDCLHILSSMVRVYELALDKVSNNHARCAPCVPADGKRETTTDGGLFVSRIYTIGTLTRGNLRLDSQHTGGEDRFLVNIERDVGVFLRVSSEKGKDIHESVEICVWPWHNVPPNSLRPILRP